MQAGLTKDQAHILTDLSKHAFDEASDAMMRIAAGAPEELIVPIVTSVMGSFAKAMREQFPDHWQAFLTSEQPVDQPSVIVLPAGS